MKPLISQFKISLFTKCKGRHWGKVAAGLLLLAFSPGACQLSRSRDSTTAGKEPVGSPSSSLTTEGQDALNIRPPFAPPPEPLQFTGPVVSLVRSQDQGLPPLALLQKPVCSDQVASSLALHMRLNLKSVVGSHKVDLLIKSRIRIPAADPLATDTIQADVEGYKMTFSIPGNLPSDIWSKACLLENSDEAPRLVVDDAAVDQIHDWLEVISPDCEHFTFGANGWTCHLPTIDPEVARTELNGIQSTMITRWSRQPYLLARRVAIGLTMAHALKQTRDSQEGHPLDTFCRIISSALPIELPATLASQRWQKAVCEGETTNRKAAALFGLSKTVSEIDFMRQLFERTSRLGHLSLKIPSSKIPGTQILVRLAPESDVADNLAYETARLWANDDNQSEDIENGPKACWHPIYGEHPRFFNLARQLGMTGDASRITCEDIRDYRGTSPFPSSERYFADSVTSETEFILQNGRSKTLRLPSGKYSYTLRILPDDPEIWDDVSQQTPTASGFITWDKKRPRPIISDWE